MPLKLKPFVAGDDIFIVKGEHKGEHGFVVSADTKNGQWIEIVVGLRGQFLQKVVFTDPSMIKHGVTQDVSSKNVPFNGHPVLIMEPGEYRLRTGLAEEAKGLPSVAHLLRSDEEIKVKVDPVNSSRAVLSKEMGKTGSGTEEVIVTERRFVKRLPMDAKPIEHIGLAVDDDDSEDVDEEECKDNDSKEPRREDNAVEDDEEHEESSASMEIEDDDFVDSGMESELDEDLDLSSVDYADSESAGDLSRDDSNEESDSMSDISEVEKDDMYVEWNKSSDSSFTLSSEDDEEEEPLNKKYVVLGGNFSICSSCGETLYSTDSESRASSLLGNASDYTTYLEMMKSVSEDRDKRQQDHRKHKRVRQNTTSTPADWNGSSDYSIKLRNYISIRNDNCSGNRNRDPPGFHRESDGSV